MPRFAPSEATAATETWLRREGLPAFVVAHRRASLLVARTTPFVVAAFYLGVARWIAANTVVTVGTVGTVNTGVTTGTISTISTFDDGAASALPAVLGVTAVWVLLPVLAFIFTANLVRFRPRRMNTVGAAVLAGFVVVEPTLEASWPLAALADLGLVVGALLVTWMGLGALVSWAARTAARRVRALWLVAARAVPLLLLVVVATLFSRSLWEMTGQLSPGRLLAVIVFFVVLDLLVIVPLTRGEMAAMDARGDTGAKPGPSAGATRAPEGPPAPPPGPSAGPPLSPLERANIQAVLILAQCLQVAIFFSLVAAFLVVLGALALPGALLAEWSGTDPTPLTVAGVALPVDVVLVRTALFLSCISSLNFLVTASNQSAYKSAFYDPLFAGAQAALIARSEYRRGLENPHKLEV